MFRASGASSFRRVLRSRREVVLLRVSANRSYAALRTPAGDLREVCFSDDRDRCKQQGTTLSLRGKPSTRQTSYLRSLGLFLGRCRRMIVVVRIRWRAKWAWRNDWIFAASVWRSGRRIDLLLNAIQSWRCCNGCCWHRIDVCPHRTRSTHRNPGRCGDCCCLEIFVIGHAAERDEGEGEACDRYNGPQRNSHGRTLARPWPGALWRVRFRARGKHRDKRPIERPLFTCAGRRTRAGTSYASPKGSRAAGACPGA